MPEDLFVRIDSQRTLWLMEIARQTFEDQRLEDLESDGGLFLILEDSRENRFQVLAKAASHSAGRAMLELCSSSMVVA
ncbi:hypothetical protein [Phenylobacterium sp.]|uniref:hypothetical protein n=1 Tax=Phenylobacterium sp. TaxID=1871053 RepID=UPI00403715A0